MPVCAAPPPCAGRGAVQRSACCWRAIPQSRPPLGRDGPDAESPFLCNGVCRRTNLASVRVPPRLVAGRRLCAHPNAAGVDVHHAGEAQGSAICAPARCPQCPPRASRSRALWWTAGVYANDGQCESRGFDAFDLLRPPQNPKPGAIVRLCISLEGCACFPFSRATRVHARAHAKGQEWASVLWVKGACGGR